MDKIAQCNTVLLFLRLVYEASFYISHPKIEVNTHDNKGWNALVWAYTNNHKDVVKLLLDKCELCPKEGLKQHVIIHTGIKSFSCEFCGKAFAIKKILNAHTNTHTGEYKVKCEICKKEYANKASLFTHMKIHNNPKAHKCDICNSRFTQKCALKTHLKSRA